MAGRDEISILEAELRKLEGALDELDALTQQLLDETTDPDEAETVVITTQGSPVPAKDHVDDDQDDFIEHHRQHGWLERDNR